MKELKIRLATSHDSQTVSRLLYQAFKEVQSVYSAQAFRATVISPEEVRRRMDEGPLWVAEYHGELVGTACILPKENEMYLRGMAVAPDARGLKIGLALLQKAEDFAMEAGCKRLFLLTTPYLEKACKLYQRFGFVRLAQEQDDFFGTPSFMMEKKYP